MALAAAVLSSALVLAGCARDTGSAPAAGGGEEETCARNAAPAAAGGAAPSAAPLAPNADASALRVALAYDVGGRGDQSFNDSAAAGLEQAISEIGVVRENTRELAAANGESEDARATRLRQLATDGFSPVIAVGFAYSEALTTIAAEFPDTQFAIIDSVVDLPNVTSLTFAAEQGSFLVGAAAALRTTSCQIGFVGGVEVPLIQAFEAGYVAGAKAVAPDVEVDVDYISPAGDFSGFNDPARGTEVARGQLDGGADVVYHAAGGSGQGVFEAVAAATTPDAPKFAIGVDSDQYNTVAAPVNEVIMTSMLKRVDVAVFNYVNAVAAGDLAVIPPAFDLSVDGVGYSTTGGGVDDLVTDLDAYKAAIVNGDITVPSTP
ncbi:BMP family ABC transporter substrate-binding protein [Pseudonocardia sp. KRD-184]|uniref:BMP family ABC transporter substrate-binding protein n=1 Tax=Pseudonocardia oceani TaxID=2792013 RepID=A0ABS6U6L7_9PSEU|nr:BMP family ABC transporter substrate-binding protein [Pseudonocardia oceani]MBW0088475.1 BMP family ABC transporter substrate-binding protein [Pseudonocardia oceani]MBW0095175.1 BMP family ABC transporter substrate-binding protein [Pseudonocardia oceani]MBW0108035.1 BMP family ABC transporter substrate-binding protein [Pseudonocardia oceani]MBW0120725.1 BMP family ABC transporter substrate-binding protein [Pseudonocardia oceani]MBW0127867.1 BMP family ABC transporter substrate-binding prote